MNKLSFAGEYKISKANLNSYNGNSVSILDLIHEISVFEDIYSPFLSMELLIEDQIGLYQKLPIIGEEVLEISITNVDGNGGYKDFNFSVFKAKDFLEKSQKGFMYTLCCISTEAIVDMNIKISKAYSGTASDIAKILLKKEGLTTEKPIYIEESTNQIAYISNYWNPIKNFRYLSDRAISKATKSPSYLLFENKYGFFFSSLAALKSQEPVAVFSNSIRTDQSIEDSLTRVEKIFIDRSFDYIERLKTGALGSTVVYVDSTRKSYGYRYFDFLDSFDKFPRLNELPIASVDATRRTNAYFELNQTGSYVNPRMKNEYSETWLQERKSELGNLKAFEIQIEVPGNMEIAVGHTTDFYFYSGDVPNSSDLNSILDPLISGRYMITAIRHVFTRTRHTMLMTLSKDSTAKR